jgi:high-affinity Fe2+/Pb2+ permease
MSDVERLLRSALVPVEPPESLTDRLERRLTEHVDAAVEELSEWEPGALRDPRNWVRTAAAGAVLAAAGGTLVLVRARQQHKKRQAGAFRALEQSIEDVSSDIRKRLKR